MSVLTALAMLPAHGAAADATAIAASTAQQSKVQVQVGEDEDEENDASEEETEADDEDRGVEDGAVYESPTFGFRLEYDAAVWEVVEEEAVRSADVVTFANGPSFVTLSATRAHHGDIEDCFEDWVSSLASGDGVDDFAPFEDDDGEPIQNAGGDFVRAVFAFESSDGDEVFDLECRVLVEDEASLTIVLETFAAAYHDEVAARDDLLDGLDLSGVEPASDVVVIADDFEDQEEGIFSTESGNPDLVRYAYDDGEYVIETLDRDAGTWQVQLNGPFGDVEVAVDARIVGATRGRYVKIGCRFARAEDGFDEYAMVLDPDARRVLLYRSVGEEVTILVDESGLDAINPDEEVNRLALRCVGETIEAAINGEKIASLDDGAHAAGAVYLGAGSYTDAPRAVEAHFDNFELRVLDVAVDDRDDEAEVADDDDGDRTIHHDEVGRTDDSTAFAETGERANRRAVSGPSRPATLQEMAGRRSWDLVLGRR